MNINNDTAWGLYLSKYDGKWDVKAKDFGLNAKLYMKGKQFIDNTKGDDRQEKIDSYLQSICGGKTKAYWYLMGTQYKSARKDDRYIKYFGRQDID